MTTTHHKGAIVGFAGHRAVVSDIDGESIRIAYIERLPARLCNACDGRGWISLAEWWPSKNRTTSCSHCRGTGELPAEQVERVEWVRAEDLGEPPARVEREDAAEVASFISKPRAVFE